MQEIIFREDILIKTSWNVATEVKIAVNSCETISSRVLSVMTDDHFKLTWVGTCASEERVWFSFIYFRFSDVQIALLSWVEPTPPAQFKVDHPFLYVIREIESNTVIFGGKLVKLS